MPENIKNDIFNKFTTHYKKSIVTAYGLSLAKQKKEIDVENIFWALISQKGSLGHEILSKAGIKPLASFSPFNQPLDLEQIICSQEQLALSRQAKKVIVDSAALAVKYQHSYIGTEHLLHSLLKLNDTNINYILAQHKVRLKDLLKNLEVILNSTAKFSEMTNAAHSIKEKIKQDKKQVKSKTDSLLDFFATDLTNKTVQQNINTLVGRQEEVNRIIQILSRRNKNNPILLGEPGVGKTVIVEGLAKKIMDGDVPDLLLDKKIYSLDMPLLVAGTMYRGEFEARLKQVLDEIKADPNIILFIDEIHNIMGAGSSSGTMDAANILKPALGRGEIRCIGATTYDDYKKYIEPDAALVRRLQKVTVLEPSQAEAIQILHGIKQAYEKHHLIKITDEAISQAVNLSVRYITDQFLPDKAIDLIDEAASKKRVNQPRNVNYQRRVQLEKELIETSHQKNSLVAKEDYEQALELKNKEMDLVNQIYKIEKEEIKKKIKIDPTQIKNEITQQDIRNLVAEAMKINIPDTAQSGELIKNLFKNLKSKIIGQDRVIQDLVNTLKRSAAGLNGGRRPLGSFIFAGPSGVGKTYTAKILAEVIFPGKDNLIKLDMSEFGEKFNASKILGAPAGYVGYDQGGLLTEKVKRNPYCVILLDEIEKAHPDIFNLFLQILEDGYLTDAKGRQVNFKNTIIIMTTNVGLKKGMEKQSLGFDEELEADLANSFKESLQEFMRPEFLNRINQILVFNSLTKRDLAKIIQLELNYLNQNLAQQNLDLKWDKEVIVYLLKKCIQLHQGARAIREVLREYVENPLAEKILHDNKKGIINLIVKNDKIFFE